VLPSFARKTRDRARDHLIPSSSSAKGAISIGRLTHRKINSDECTAFWTTRPQALARNTFRLPHPSYSSRAFASRSDVMITMGRPFSSCTAFPRCRRSSRRDQSSKKSTKLPRPDGWSQFVVHIQPKSKRRAFRNLIEPMNAVGTSKCHRTS
jgi:hypothetical protein